MKRWTIIISGALAIAIVVGSFIYWWNPLLFPVPHSADVYTLNEGLTTKGPEARPASGLCDADTYYVRVNGDPLCVTLNGAIVGGPALAQVRFDIDESRVTLDGGQASVLRVLVPQIEEKTSAPSRTFVLVFRGSPIAFVSVDELQGEGAVTVPLLE